mmetsp:Transcript_3488/g.5439  ORF Transcript_3488/g.5439 Transcript_3488/m.5439 type:complete len:1094 (+) Transcript_3488:90-3371(+)
MWEWIVVLLLTGWTPQASSRPVVSFRLDDVQAYWCEDISKTIIDIFIEEEVELNIGIIGKYLDQSVNIASYLTDIASNPLLEMTSHSNQHQSFNGKTLSWQRSDLSSANSMIQDVTGKETISFITPYNTYDSTTPYAMLAEDMNIISAECAWVPYTEIILYCPPGSNVVAPNIGWNGIYSLPAGAVLGSQAYWNDYSLEGSLSSAIGWIETQIANQGFSVVMLHPVEFATSTECTTLNSAKVQVLRDLISYSRGRWDVMTFTNAVGALTGSSPDTDTLLPTVSPTIKSTLQPTVNPTNNPTIEPTREPSVSPSFSPTNFPTPAANSPTPRPTLPPTTSPSNVPTVDPSPPPTTLPSPSPTITPTDMPSMFPTRPWTNPPSKAPSTTSRPTQTPMRPVVVFRLDDVQAWWCESIARMVIDLFLQKQIPVNLGVLGMHLSQSSDLVTYLQRVSASPLVEIADHSYSHASFAGKSFDWQQNDLASTNAQIFSATGVVASTFIAPYNTFDDNTFLAMKSEGMNILSGQCEWAIDSSSVIYCPPGNNVVAPNIVRNDIHILPAGAVLGDELYWEDYSRPGDIDKAKGWIESQIANQGFAVMMLHPFEFAVDNECTNLDTAKLSILEELMAYVNANYDVRTFTDAANIVSNYSSTRPPSVSPTTAPTQIPTFSPSIAPSEVGFKSQGPTLIPTPVPTSLPTASSLLLNEQFFDVAMWDSVVSGDTASIIHILPPSSGGETTLRNEYPNYIAFGLSYCDDKSCLNSQLEQNPTVIPTTTGKYWFGLRFRIPTNFTWEGRTFTGSEHEFFNIFELMRGKGDFTPSMRLRITDGTRYQVVVCGHKSFMSRINTCSSYTVYREVETGVWMDWVFYIDMQYNGAGAIKVWLGETLLLSEHNVLTAYNDDKPPYIKIGVGFSRWKTDSTLTTWYGVDVSEVRVGNELSCFDQVYGGGNKTGQACSVSTSVDDDANHTNKGSNVVMVTVVLALCVIMAVAVLLIVFLNTKQKRNLGGHADQNVSQPCTEVEGVSMRIRKSLREITGKEYDSVVDDECSQVTFDLSTKNFSIQPDTPHDIRSSDFEVQVGLEENVSEFDTANPLYNA